MARMIAGERLWHGGIVSPQLAAAYNSLQDRMETFWREGRSIPDELLNGSHNLLQPVLETAK